MLLSVEETVKHAQECVELAQNASEPQRAKLLELAQAWIRLADEGALMMAPD